MVQSPCPTGRLLLLDTCDSYAPLAAHMCATMPQLVRQLLRTLNASTRTESRKQAIVV